MLTLDITPHILDRVRKLTIDPEFIEFDNTNLYTDRATRLNRGEVEGIRFGVKWLSGYKFVIGRTFCIDIKGPENRIIKIRLTTFYGIRKTTLQQKYSLIFDALMGTHHNDMLNKSIRQFNAEGVVQILNTTFSWDWVLIKGKQVPWEDLGTKAYTTYYALFSKKDPTIYQSYSYLEDWNTALVYSLSRHILNHKGFIE